VTEVRAVLLDLYDTLVWSDWPVMRAELEERLGIGEADLIRSFVRTRPARSVGAFGSAEGDLRAVLEDAGLDPDPQLVRELSRERVERFLVTGVHLWEDSIPTIRALRRRGVLTAVVSNCDHATRPVVERLGLVEETDAVVLSFEVQVAKPDPGIYLAALERLRVAPGEAVFVDDQARYCDGATALGIESLLLLRDGSTPPEGVSAPGDHRVIRDLRALLDLV
jgi:putative hydrolase of the HAD superfamily